MTPPRWGAGGIPDQTGRVALVTGANSGLGLATARQLVRHGARVILACRDAGRAEQARRRLAGEMPAAARRLSVTLVDLADLATVRRAAGELHRQVDRLDLLVNNAGVMALPRRRTRDGFEMQFGTNHLGHFALTGLLLPLLHRGVAPRVVTIASAAHRIGRIDFDDLHGERHYRRWSAYGASKLANLLFTAELDRRACEAGWDLVSVAAHPGFAATNLQAASARMTGNKILQLMMAAGNVLFAQTDAAGALPVLYAATAPDVVGGEYFGPDGIAEMRGHPVRVGRSARAVDAAAAERLWTVSEQLTGVRADFTATG